MVKWGEAQQRHHGQLIHFVFPSSFSAAQHFNFISLPNAQSGTPKSEVGMGRGNSVRSFSSFLSNCERARPLRTRPHKRVTLIMIGLFTTEATIKIKHFRGEELILMEKHMLLALVADGQTAASWGEEKNNCKHSP